jgi:phenylpyruvate tautomerase PptA (4-oxalocrotonate tautomerase family)
MPIVKIEVCRPCTPEQVSALIDAVHAAQVEALKIPESDKVFRFVEHTPQHFPVPPGKTENYTIVEIVMFPGRSIDAKRKLYQGIVSRFGELGIDARDVIIVLLEPPLHNWGIRGQPASDIDLGFKLDV